MPAKSHGKKRSNQRRPVEKAAAVERGVPEPVKSTAAAPTNVTTAPATAVRPVAKPLHATQPAPRRFYVGRELLRVAIVSVITLAILIVLVIVLR
jgi:hypothetical protein